MGGSKKQTVGYRYFMGLHFGICQGPVDALLEIRGGDRVAWKGSATSSQRININAPELWGGEKKEGGIVGPLDVMMGEPSQAPNDYLASQIVGPMPAFRGFLSLVFRKGMVGAMNPYPKPWSFNVRRILNGWHGGPWYPEVAAITLSSVEIDIGISPTAGGWRYKVVSNSDPADYSADELDDSGWDTGASPFASSSDHPYAEGAGYPRERGTAWAVNTGIWIRRVFNIPRPVTIRMETFVDNFATVWVNGQLVLPRVGSIVVGNTTVFWHQFEVPASILRAGDNTIAIKAEDYGTYTYAALRVIGTVTTGRAGMNPAHIIYQALTDPDWGMGYPVGALDLDSFENAAENFYREGLALCGQWTRQDTIESFVQEVLSHAGAALGQDPRTGLFRLIPTRGGYDPASIPEFRRGLNVSAVDSFERAALGETVNEVTVQYVDASTGNDGAVTVQHLANVQAQGGVVSQSVRYPMAPTASIAQRLAQRDLTTKASPLCKVKLTTDRSAFGLLPGDVVRWTDAKLGITDMPMRVLQVDYGSLTAGAIKLDLAEDVFGMPATTYLGQQEGGWVEPSTEPKPPAAAQAFEIPYLAIHRAEGGSVANALAQDAGYLGMLAAKAPGVSYGYTLMASVAGGEFEQVGGGEWAASAILAADIGPADTVLPLGGVTDAGEFAAGALVMIGGGDDAELVRIDSAAPGAASITVGRGVGDTVAGPAGWPIGTRVWVVDDNVGEGVTEYVEGETVEAKASTNAPGGTLPLGDSPGGTTTMAARAARPYPPAGLTVGGAAWPAQVIGDIELAWSHRDRLLQADQLVDQAAGSIGPEAGTTYTVRTYLDDVLDDEQTGIAGAAATVLPSGNGVARVEVLAVRDGLESWQAQVREFRYRATPYDDYTDQDGIAYADQDGQTYEG